MPDVGTKSTSGLDEIKSLLTQLQDKITALESGEGETPEPTTPQDETNTPPEPTETLPGENAEPTIPTGQASMPPDTGTAPEGSPLSDFLKGKQTAKRRI